MTLMENETNYNNSQQSKPFFGSIIYSIKPELCDRVRDEALSHNKSGSLDSKA